ncbi:MAG: hypothetical protein LAP21_02905 [Acidobacteriia bacterium]|nr:hypothetical protein [Terriglobia bacterium]
MAVEDERAAVAFSVTLSSQLISASMATLAVEGAYVWYALGSRLTSAGFLIFAALAGLLISCSIFSGGKGITAARNAGFNANWSLTAGKSEFNLQGILLLGALVMLTIMFCLSGQGKESALEKRIQGLELQTNTLRQELSAQSSDHRVESKAIADKLATISIEVQKVRDRHPGRNSSKP